MLRNAKGNTWLDRRFTRLRRKNSGPTGRGWRRLGCTSWTRGRLPLRWLDHADPVGALAQWSREKLIVPPGHPLAGQPMTLTDFSVEWLRESWDAHESALSTARKNAKSAIAAVLALGYLVGPLRRPGWRGAIASLSKEKAGELRRQVSEIAESSGLDVKIRRSPYPGTIESSTGSLDTLSADRSAGHASGYDLCLIDETGLFPLRARDLLAGLRSSVSARNGKIRHISIRGDSELFAEILSNPAVRVAHLRGAGRLRGRRRGGVAGGESCARRRQVDRVHAIRRRTREKLLIRRAKFSGSGPESSHQSDKGNDLRAGRYQGLLR